MGDAPEPTKRDRLVEIYRRIALAPTSSTADEAYRLLCEMINAVEDEMTSIPYDPPTPPADDGRIYPPMEDFRKKVKGRPDLDLSRKHKTIIGANGAITIATRPGAGVVVFEKPGSNGKGT